MKIKNKKKIKKIKKTKKIKIRKKAKKPSFKRKKVSKKRKKLSKNKKKKTKFNIKKKVKIPKIYLKAPKFSFWKKISFQGVVEWLTFPLFLAYENFREKRKISRLRKIALEKKERERQIKEERRLRYEAKKQQLRDEVKLGHYDVTIIGGSGKRRMAHDLIQYIDSSIFVVNQFDPNQKYRLLLAVDDSTGTKGAVKFGVRVAQAFKIDVDILTVSKVDRFGDGYKGAAERAGKFMRRTGIQYQNIYRVGDPSEIIKNEAGDNHIVIMGASSKNPLMKFFKGSKPLKVMEDCPCPILIVK